MKITNVIPCAHHRFKQKKKPLLITMLRENLNEKHFIYIIVTFQPGACSRIGILPKL